MIEEIVLLFAYHFPPENAIGAVRPYRFQKYFGRLGVRCHVISAAPVFVRPDLDAEYVPDPFLSKPRQGIGWQVERAIRKFALPGVTGIQWSLAAYRRARDFIRTQPNARFTVLSTYPPLGTHLAGYLLCRKTGLPWIADFRDPLANNPGSGDIHGFQQAIYRKLERLFVKQATCVIANTDAASDSLQTTYPHFAERVHLLWNGFDPEERMEPAPIPDRKQKIFSHVGELYEGRDVRQLLASIARLVKSGRLDPLTFQIQLIGPARNTSIPDPSFIAEAAQQGWLKLVSQQVPREEAQEITRTSDGLLLVQPHSKLQVPGKLYEYIQIGRPILAFILPDSPAERILAKSGIPYQCAYTSDRRDVFDDSVLKFFRLNCTAKRPSGWFEENFNTQHHAEQLYELIRRIHGTRSVAANQTQAHETPGT